MSPRIDLMAADLALDPAAVRLRNLLTPADLPYGLGHMVPYEAPSEYDTGDYGAALRRALGAIDYPAIAPRNAQLVDGRRHGVGIGCFVESSGSGPFETARVVLRHPGRSSSTPAARRRDRAARPCWRKSSPTRGAQGVPPVLALAALATDPSPDAAAAREAVGQFRPAKLTYTYGAQIAHVAIDVETGVVELLRLVAVEDVGRAINPMLVHGQALGAAVQGLGGALMERLAYDDGGQLVTGTFADYAVPTADAFPHIDAITLEDAPSPLNPLGAKGVDEGGLVATGAAFANAVAAALGPMGAAVLELPLSADRVFALLTRGRSTPS